MKRLFAYVCVLVSSFGYAVYSYSQLDPNLVLSSFAPYWKFQEAMWQIGYHQRDLSTILFASLVTVFFIGWWCAVTSLHEHEKWSLFFTVVIFMVLTHNALSHDVFNYMFNARMVVKYHANPHMRVALEFSSDDWTRFMHNTHTPAPYGYGWTVLSLIPYVFGLNKFNPTYLAFKLFMVAGLLLMYRASAHLAKICKKEKDFHYLKWLVLLNPLVLLELIGNVHNDAWMMAFTLFAYGVAWSLHPKERVVVAVGKIIFAIALLIISASIKFATILLFPILIGIGLVRYSKNVPHIITRVIEYWPEWSAFLLFFPLFTDRSQQFHPWYLSWGLVFVPFMRKTWIRMLYLAFSISSMMRYIPFLRLGEYTADVLAQQKMITWGFGLALFLVFLGMRRVFEMKKVLRDEGNLS